MRATARSKAAADKSQEIAGLTPFEIADLERLLEREMGRAMRALNSMRSEALRDMSVSEGGDMIDRTTAAAIREQAGNGALREQSRLREIEEALTRLRTRKYGTCESCGTDIGYVRLEAIPTTRYCAEHSG